MNFFSLSSKWPTHWALVWYLPIVATSMRSVFDAIAIDVSRILNCYCDISNDETNMPSYSAS